MISFLSTIFADLLHHQTFPGCLPCKSHEVSSLLSRAPTKLHAGAQRFDEHVPVLPVPRTLRSNLKRLGSQVETRKNRGNLELFAHPKICKISFFPVVLDGLEESGMESLYEMEIFLMSARISADSSQVILSPPQKLGEKSDPVLSFWGSEDDPSFKVLGIFFMAQLLFFGEQNHRLQQERSEFIPTFFQVCWSRRVGNIIMIIVIDDDCIDCCKRLLLKI